MEVNHLKYFYYVAKFESFTLAAKTLRIAQPAVSKMVANLEDSIGHALFDRVGKKIHLTKYGSDLYRRCEIIFDQIAEIEVGLSRKPNQLSGSLIIGTIDAIATYFLPKSLKILLTKHPKIFPTVATGTASELIGLLKIGKIDFVLAFHVPSLPPELEIRKLYPIPFKLVVSSSAKNSKTICSSFIGSREVDDISTKTYPTLKKLQNSYPDASIRISSNCLSAHKSMVTAGMGVSILPDEMVKDDVSSGAIFCLLPDEDFVFQMKLIIRRSEPLSDASARLVEILEASLGRPNELKSQR